MTKNSESVAHSFEICLGVFATSLLHFVIPHTITIVEMASKNMSSFWPKIELIFSKNWAYPKNSTFTGSPTACGYQEKYFQENRLTIVEMASKNMSRFWPKIELIFSKNFGVSKKFHFHRIPQGLWIPGKIFSEKSAHNCGNGRQKHLPFSPYFH